MYLNDKQAYQDALDARRLRNEVLLILADGTYDFVKGGESLDAAMSVDKKYQVSKDKLATKTFDRVTARWRGIEISWFVEKGLERVP